jgi:hypothetical protein
MGLVAGVAEHTTGVFGGNHLGEACGFGGILLMAAAAEVGDVGELGFEGGRVAGLGVGGLRTVARLAGDMGMAAPGAHFGLIVVTQDTGILSGVGDGTRADQVECGGPVVAVLAESFGNDRGADHQKKAENGEEDEGRADEMPGVAHDTFQASTPFLTRN